MNSPNAALGLDTGLNGFLSICHSNEMRNKQWNDTNDMTQKRPAVHMALKHSNERH